MCDDDNTFFGSPFNKRPSLVICTNTLKGRFAAAIAPDHAQVIPGANRQRRGLEHFVIVEPNLEVSGIEQRDVRNLGHGGQSAALGQTQSGGSAPVPERRLLGKFQRLVVLLEITGSPIARKEQHRFAIRIPAEA